MNRINIDEIENSVQPAVVIRKLTKPLGLTDVAINYYELEPGDSFAFAYHNHEIQEEVFFVWEGTATFDTEEGTIEIGPGEAVRFDREEFQRGWNRGDERVRALAIGAPLEYGQQMKLRYCQACEEETAAQLTRAEDEAAVIARCVVCGSETGRWYEGSMEGEVP